jgi:hypothetical protein
MHRLLLLFIAVTVAFACETVSPIWIQRSPSADPLYRFEKNGKVGYIDGNGRIIIPPRLAALCVRVS